MKKMFCAFLAIAMCMALALPAFADDENQIASGTNYTGSVTTPTIKVTAPTSAAVILNPYLIAIEKNSVVSGSGANTIQPSVITPTLVLKNESNVPLKMTLTVTGEIPNGSTAKFLTAAPAPTEKNHGVFMYVDVLNKGSLATAPEASQVLSGITAYADANVYSATNTTGTQCVVKAGAVKMTDFITLAVPAANQAGYVTIDIGGECATTPTDAWAATDTVNVALAFTFTSTSNSTGSGA